MQEQLRGNQQRTLWLAQLAAFCWAAFCMAAPDKGPFPFQIGGGESLSESASVLVGHWRKTTIILDSARDEHLVLNSDGTAENWVVTASSRGDRVSGEWSVEGKVLNLKLGDEDERSAPFTIHGGQLVYPNIQNRRKFWKRLE